jgi:hypothetical protein
VDCVYVLIYFGDGWQTINNLGRFVSSRARGNKNTRGRRGTTKKLLFPGEIAGKWRRKKAVW